MFPFVCWLKGLFCSFLCVCFCLQLQRLKFISWRLRSTPLLSMMASAKEMTLTTWVCRIRSLYVGISKWNSSTKLSWWKRCVYVLGIYSWTMCLNWPQVERLLAVGLGSQWLIWTPRVNSLLQWFLNWLVICALSMLWGSEFHWFTTRCETKLLRVASFMFLKILQLWTLYINWAVEVLSLIMSLKCGLDNMHGTWVRYCLCLLIKCLKLELDDVLKIQLDIHYWCSKCSGGFSVIMLALLLAL